MPLRRWRIVRHLLLLKQLLVLELLHTLLLVHEHVMLAGVLPAERVLVRGEQRRLQHRVRLVLLLLLVGEHLIRLSLQVDHLLVRSATIDLLEPRLFQS